MKNIFIALLSTILVSTIMASSNPNAWETLLQEVVTQGTETSTWAGIFKTLTHQESLDRAGSYHVDHLSAIGGYDSENVFRPGRIEGVSETWTRLPDGNWHVDQWLFRANLQGQPVWSAHNQMIQEPGGIVVEYNTLPTDEVATASAWAEYLAQWYHRLAKP